MAEIKKMTLDGNTATAYISYAFTEVAGIYPITPSSPMADYVDKWSQSGQTNIFGQTVNVIEMQSEGGAAGVVHGALAVGALTTTYTASQGLLLMLPNMYKIAGELMPCVFHVSARTIATHALSIFGDHSDVMAARQTGFAMLFSSSVQDTVWMAAVAHLATITSRVPFMHIFDGFRTSHEIQKVNVPSYDDLKSLTDFEAITAFRDRALSPNRPTLRGSAMNPDIFFQVREASNPYYDRVADTIAHYMDLINNLAGTDYQPYNYYGASDAERVLVCMGSAVETIKECVDFLNAKGEKVGLVNVHMYRPFDCKRFVETFPVTTTKIAVLDRTKEPGAQGEPLYQDVLTAIFSNLSGKNTHFINPHSIKIAGGRYGLSSKDTTPGDFLAVFKHLEAEQPRHNFTIGIVDDLSHLSLPRIMGVKTLAPDVVSCRFYGLGSDGTVGANKNSIKIIGDNTDLHVQAYFSYDSKKAGGITISDLRFGKNEIHATYLVDIADFTSCSQETYVQKYDMLKTLKDEGTFLLNTAWTTAELSRNLPASMRRDIANKKINFYTIDATSIAQALGLGGRINTVMQAAFFKLCDIMPMDKAQMYMRESILRSYQNKGEKVVQMNFQAIEAGVSQIVKVEIPEAWANAQDEAQSQRDVPEFVAKIADASNALKGDSLPVSAFIGMADGTLEQGTSKYEKRGIASNVPTWIPANCIQCNQCSYVCPHAVIRPFLITKEEKENGPATLKSKNGQKPYDQYEFVIETSILDCTGCGACVEICPSKEKSLVMTPINDNRHLIPNWDYLIDLKHKPNPMKNNIVKGSQFNLPYLEFSGACAGCGETPYAKLVTQLFGDRMVIANSTGCSSIWGGSAPSQPYTTDDQGRGPAWANSLFEDNAEYGLGMQIGASQIRKRLKGILQKLQPELNDPNFAAILETWLSGYARTDNSLESSLELITYLETLNLGSLDIKVQTMVLEVLDNKDYLSKRSTWIFGGDGWAYDIGFGGLDHVLSTGADVNVLVFDTEVYSNTGGQASKATPLSAIAQFAAGGKSLKKKDLGYMLMTYGYIYVAQIAMGANQAQTLKAISEAEAFEGPSLIIAYAPCIAHGIKGGLTMAQEREKQAVEAGYWHLYRYNPTLTAKGKNPFKLDSKRPDFTKFKDFLLQELRFKSLYRKYEESIVDSIFARAEAEAKERYLNYKRKENEDFSMEI